MAELEGFYRDNGFPTARPHEKRLRNLASLLTSDIANHPSGALEALDLVEQARTGRKDIEEWLGNSTSAYFRPDGVTVTDLGPRPTTTTYSLDEVHRALLRYWKFLCPTGAERLRALEQWACFYEREQPGEYDHPHPCLGHLPL